MIFFDFSKKAGFLLKFVNLCDRLERIFSSENDRRMLMCQRPTLFSIGISKFDLSKSTVKI